MKLFRQILAIAIATLGSYSAVEACTNFIVTKGAAKDGTFMVTYAADSPSLYGALYHNLGRKYAPGTMLAIYDWDSQRYLGDIPQVEETYTTVGNMNEHSLIITETTFGGRNLSDSTGRIDYGSLIYVTLQRAKTAREAIHTIVDLANTHGYVSDGESFSIADTEEAWIMELIGKGTDLDAKGNNKNKGIVWVARRIPDGYVSGHANQARITTFPQNDPENCLYADDVISFARKQGYYKGKDKDFDFSAAYCPLTFSGARACEARVWSFFNSVNSDMGQYLDYAMGHNMENRMPLWIKPDHQVDTKEMMDAMRDHYEGTAMDKSTDVGAGGDGLPYRWGAGFEVDGQKYTLERATATQQTGFWLTAQARPALGAHMGVIWFGLDDAATSCLTPFYSASREVPAEYGVKSGSLLRFDADASAFWRFSQVTNFAYMHYKFIAPDINMVSDAWENAKLEEIKAIDAEAMKLEGDEFYTYITKYSNKTAKELLNRWENLYGYLMTKHIDAKVKPERGTVLDYLDGGMLENHFIDNGHGGGVPASVASPAYDENFLRAIVNDNGDTLRVPTPKN